MTTGEVTSPHKSAILFGIHPRSTGLSGRAHRAAHLGQALLVGLLVAAGCGRGESPPLGGEAGARSEGGAGSGAQLGGAGEVAEDGGAALGGNSGNGSPAGGRQSGAGRTGRATGGALSMTGGSSQATGGDAANGGTTSAEAGTAGVEETAGAPPILDGPSVVSPGPCGFHVEVALSPAIGTVATVEWSTTLAEVESAEIDFGLDASYGLVAPVDLDEPLYRTLLLGMKPSREYHARVVVRGDGLECPSDDFALTTGPVPDGLMPVAVTTLDKARTAGGYLISSFFTDGPAFILDADGEYVWWGPPGQVGRAQLSFDGKYMWFGNVNQVGGNGLLSSVRMDGRNAQVHPEFGDSHHDFTVLPDETIGFIQHDGESDRIMERAPNGTVRKVIDVPDAFGGTPGVTRTHTNSIHYHPGDDTYTFSDLLEDAYVKVKRTGEVVWVLGGTTSDFTGDTQWRRQHGHDLIAPDRLLFFNNGPDLMPATVIELSLDLEQMTATRVWSYPGASRQAPIYGDVQRLDNGNTLVTYSSAGVIEEVTPEGLVVEMLEWKPGGNLGYAMKRASLYGPPAIR